MGAISRLDSKRPFSYKLRMLIDSIVLAGMRVVHSRWVKPVLLRFFRWGQGALTGPDKEERFQRFFGSGSLFSRWVYGAIFFVEKLPKDIFFGCSHCGQCVLSYTGYTCPMRCPKGLRNGACGGTSETGMCEVYRDRYCAWYLIYTRSQRLHRLHHLYTLRPGIDWRLVGSSSWVNLLTGRDRFGTQVGDVGEVPRRRPLPALGVRFGNSYPDTQEFRAL